MRRVFTLVFGLAIGAAWAHSDSETETQSHGEIGCDTLPANALSSLPEPVATWGVLDCLPVGQVIAQREGWTWRFPGSFFNKPWIFAATPPDSRIVPGMRYFTRLNVEHLDRATAAKRHETFRAQLPTYGLQDQPAQMLRIVAENDLSHPTEFFVSFANEHDGWAIVCVPQCAVENVFMIRRNHH